MTEAGEAPAAMVARTEPKLAEVMSRLHDSFFELPDEITTMTGTIRLTGLDDRRPKRKPIRAWGPFVRYDVSHQVVELIVHSVVAVSVEDLAMIGGFNLNKGWYSAADSELTITSGVPVTLILRVKDLHVEVAFRDELRHERTVWGLRR